MSFLGKRAISRQAPAGLGKFRVADKYPRRALEIHHAVHAHSVGAPIVAHARRAVLDKTRRQSV